MNSNECFVCGHGQHAEGGHRYYPVDEAVRDYARQPNASVSPESAYVSQHRPY